MAVIITVVEKAMDMVLLSLMVVLMMTKVVLGSLTDS
jgi:hypothetical protein